MTAPISAHRPMNMMDTKAVSSRIARWLVAACIALVGASVSGCSDDPAPPPSSVGSGGGNANRNRNAKRGAEATQQKKGEGTLQFYSKIESYVSDPEEAKALRHVFTLRDFEPDPSGEENRDPFRSFVIQQPGGGQGGASGAGQQPDEVSERCNTTNIVAPTYSLRDLELIGIVLRGTRSYALFRDRSGYGHIVRRGDCLAQEQARVTAIRTGFVSLQLAPTSPLAGAEEQPQQEREIKLYPEELSLEAEAPVELPQ